MTRNRSWLAAAIVAAALASPTASAGANPNDNATASILSSGELQVSFTDRGVHGHKPFSYQLLADGTVEYHCSEVFWGVTDWSGSSDWSDPLTADKERGAITGLLTKRIPSTDIFTPCPLGLTRISVRYTNITITDSTGGVLHADPVSAGTPVTG
jgi:hypothetical protein